MFLGQYQHNLDEKGRLTIPARYRDMIAIQGAFVMQGFDQNLMVLTTSAFDEYSHKVTAMSVTDPNARMLKRLLFSTAAQVEVDRAGRILLPQFLRGYAGLNGTAVLVGAGEYFEIWSPENWEAQAAQLQDPDANAQRFVSLEL